MTFEEKSKHIQQLIEEVDSIQTESGLKLFANDKIYSHGNELDATDQYSLYKSNIGLNINNKKEMDLGWTLVYAVVEAEKRIYPEIKVNKKKDKVVSRRQHEVSAYIILSLVVHKMRGLFTNFPRKKAKFHGVDFTEYQERAYEYVIDNIPNWNPEINDNLFAFLSPGIFMSVLKETFGLKIPKYQEEQNNYSEISYEMVTQEGENPHDFEDKKGNVENIVCNQMENERTRDARKLIFADENNMFSKESIQNMWIMKKMFGGLIDNAKDLKEYLHSPEVEEEEEEIELCMN